MTIIDDSYNANPQSMLAALTYMAQDKSPGRKIAVLGEMHELGDIAATEHKKIEKAFSAFDKIFLVGEGFKESANYRWFPEAKNDLIAELGIYVKARDKILVKGSNKVFWANNFDLVPVFKLSATCIIWIGYLCIFTLRIQKKLVTRRHAIATIILFIMAMLSLWPVESARGSQLIKKTSVTPQF